MEQQNDHPKAAGVDENIKASEVKKSVEKKKLLKNVPQVPMKTRHPKKKTLH